MECGRLWRLTAPAVPGSVRCTQFVTVQGVYPAGTGWGLAVAPCLEGLVTLSRLLALGLHPQGKPGASQTSQGRGLMLEVMVLQGEGVLMPGS